jgi:hypothetical protein
MGLLLSLAYSRAAAPTTPDSFDYMRGGQTLWRGQGFKSLAGDDQLVFPPLYPLLIGGLDRVVRDPVRAGRTISLAASLLAILLVYLLATVFSPGRPAIIAAWLFALLPVRVMTSAMVWSESVYVALVLAGLLVWVASSRRPRLGLACGVLLGAAYLTRTEGLAIFGVAALGALLAGLRHAPSWRRFALIMAGFVAVSFPYLNYLHAHTGRWQLSGKVDVNLAVAEGRTADTPWERLSTLSADDTTISLPAPTTSLRAAANRVARNAQHELELLTNMVSPFLVACVGLGLSSGAWRRRSALAWPVTLALAAPLLLLPLFFVEKRMLLLSAVLPILLAAPAGSEKLPEDAPSLGLSRLAITYAALAGSFLWMLGANGSLMASGRSVSIDALTAAVQQTVDAPGPILGDHALAFRTERDYLAVPWAPLDRVLRYAHYHQAAFMVVSTRDHPELAALARRPRETAGLMPLARVEYHLGEEQVIEQLYRLRRPSP